MSRGYLENDFTQVPNAFFDIACLLDLKPSVWKVYLALCKRANKDGQCWPSFETIGEDANTSRSVVATAIKELEDAGIVRVERRPKQTSNLYSLLPLSDVLAEAVSKSDHLEDEVVRKSDQSENEIVRKSDHLEDEVVRKSDGGWSENHTEVVRKSDPNHIHNHIQSNHSVSKKEYGGLPMSPHYLECLRRQTEKSNSDHGKGPTNHQGSVTATQSSREEKVAGGSSPAGKVLAKKGRMINKSISVEEVTNWFRWLRGVGIDPEAGGHKAGWIRLLRYRDDPERLCQSVLEARDKNSYPVLSPGYAMRIYEQSSVERRAPGETVVAQAREGRRDAWMYRANPEIDAQRTDRGMQLSPEEDARARAERTDLPDAGLSEEEREYVLANRTDMGYRLTPEQEAEARAARIDLDSTKALQDMVRRMKGE